MSRRFGRNQRRQMREQLEALNVNNAKLTLDNITLCRADKANSKIIASQGNRLINAVGFAKSVARVVAHEAVIAGLPNTIDYLLSHGEDQFELATGQPVWEAGTTKTEILHLLQVRAVANRINQQIHVAVKLADGQAGYCISRSALREMQEDVLVERMAHELARILVNEIRKAAQP